MIVNESSKRADGREAAPRARYCQASGLRFDGRFGYHAT